MKPRIPVSLTDQIALGRFESEGGMVPVDPTIADRPRNFFIFPNDVDDLREARFQARTLPNPFQTPNTAGVKLPSPTEIVDIRGPGQV